MSVRSFLAHPRVNKRDVERGFGPSPPVHSEWGARLRVSRPTNDPVSGVSEWRHAAPNHARPTGPAASSPPMGLGGLCNSSCAVRPSCCPSSDGARRTTLRTGRLPVHMRAYSLTPSQRYFHSHRIPDSSHPLGFSWKIWVWMAEVFAFKMLA